MNSRWIIINAVLKKVFAKDMVRPSDQSSAIASVAIADRTFAIMEDRGAAGIKLQLRASLTPTDAARITTAIGYVYPIFFGSHFEMTSKGELLYGDKALEYVWGHMPFTIQEAIFDDKSLDKQYDQPN